MVFSLFDWGVTSCPMLCEKLKIPKLFAHDWFQRLPPGSLYREAWPSLFVAGTGNRCGLHIDADGTHFWMSLMQVIILLLQRANDRSSCWNCTQGSKEWSFFHPEDTCLLYPQYHASLDPVFEGDVDEGNAH